MSLLVSIYYILLLLFISNGYCGSLEETLGQNKEVNNGVINRLLSKSIKRKLLSGADIGESCAIDFDCEGWGEVKDGVTAPACCDDICTERVRDWAGDLFCPNDCKGRAAASGGTCPLKEEGEPCKVHEDCKGMGLATYDIACCDPSGDPFKFDGYCTKKVKDWAGVGYCPSECVGRAKASGGTCPLKEVGESCIVHEDCAGMGLGTYDIACCGNSIRFNSTFCTKKVKDWAGIGYCPQECKGHEAASGGTCPLKEIGESCKLHEDCKDMGLGTYDVACCKGTCLRKQKDFAGVGYCPHECRGGWNCGAGTCPSGRSSGSSCSCSGMCSSGCCEGGKCVDKKKDWAKTYWCPAECKNCGWPWCKAGTC